MDKRKVIIVGASHGGHESAIELLDKYDDVDVTIYEAGDFISFMSCGMQLYLEGKVTAKDDVRNFAPEDVEAKGGHVYDNHEVTAIHPDDKTVTVKDVVSGKESQVEYDKLILSSGVTPKTLPVPNSDLKNIFLMRGRDWATKLNAAKDDPAIKNVVVIGAGYIGIEASEVFAKAGGKHVTLMDMIDRPLGTYLNPELTNILEPVFKDHMDLKMNAKITGFKGEDKVSGVETDQGVVPADLVIVSAGVTPNTAWLKGTVDLDQRGWIKTDPYLRTNVKDVYAIGDAILPLSIPAGKPMPIALATTARREAQYLVNHLFEAKPDKAFKGVTGASALSVFDYHFATAGLNQFSAKRNDVPYATSFYEDSMRPAYIPEKDNPKVYVSLTFNPYSHQILGGTVLSKYDITAQGNVLALAVSHKMTLEDLAEQDFFFQPGFDRQWSLLNLAAQHALGLAKF